MLSFMHVDWYVHVTLWLTNLTETRMNRVRAFLTFWQTYGTVRIKPSARWQTIARRHALFVQENSLALLSFNLRHVGLAHILINRINSDVISLTRRIDLSFRRKGLFGEHRGLWDPAFARVNSEFNLTSNFWPYFSRFFRK